jgi:hypothetical protein
MAKPKKNTIIMDWSALLSGLIVLGLTLIIGVAMIVGSQLYLSRMTKWELEQRRHFSGVVAEYSQLQETLYVVNHFYIETFHQLKKNGFFQSDGNSTIEEQRLTVYENIQSHLSKLPLFNYRISVPEEKPYPIPDFLDTESEFKMYQIPISLESEVLHEEDVLQFIKTIEFQKHHWTGLFNLQSCDMKRYRELIQLEDVEKPYFFVKCVWTWYISKIEPDE